MTNCFFKIIFSPPVLFQSATLPIRMRGSSAPSSFLQEKMEELQLNKDKRKEPDWTRDKKRLLLHLVLEKKLFKTHWTHISLQLTKDLNCAHTLYRCINVKKMYVGTIVISATPPEPCWTRTEPRDPHQHPLPIYVNINECFYKRWTTRALLSPLLPACKSWEPSYASLHHLQRKKGAYCHKCVYVYQKSLTFRVFLCSHWHVSCTVNYIRMCGCPRP